VADQPPRAEKMRQPKIGYDYVHSLVDDYSRLAYSEILTDETGTTCAAFLLGAAAYFGAHGIPRIERLITDNALAYRHSTAVNQAVAQLGAKHKFIKPHCPWQNGKVERVQPHPADRMGLPADLPQQPRPRRRACPLAGVLQHSTPTHRTWRPPANQPTVTNLVTGYT
jgi:transposase InsO family protein